MNKHMTMKARGVALLIVMLGSCACVAGQEKAQDRRKFLSPSTPVSDDPRRIPVKPGPMGPERILVLRGGRIFDGTGTAVHEGTLVIERNKILKILPPSSSDWPKNAEVVDVAGKTILPGLIDLHTHLTYPVTEGEVLKAPSGADATLRAVEKLRYFLESGITSVRDVGSQGDVTFRLKEWVRENRLAGPRVFPAGQFITAEGGHSTEKTFYIQRAVEAGADTIEHPLPRTDETIQLMAKKGVAADPTLIPYQIIFDEWGGYFGSTSRRFTFSNDANLEMLRRLKRAGIKCGVGTDLILHWYRYLPGAYIRELKNFVAAGWSAPEALVAATKTNSEILDMDDRLGTLEPGKLADVLVVDGRPDENLDDLAKVDLVVRDGNTVVQGGKVAISRHTVMPPPKKAQ